MKFRQNKKRIDPRYFLNEQDDEVYQDVTGKIIQGSGGAGSEVMFYDEGGAYTKDDDEILPVLHHVHPFRFCRWFGYILDSQ